MSDRKKTGYSPLNAESSRDITIDVMFAYANEKINILPSVFSIFIPRHIQPHNNGGVWFYFGRPCVRPSVRPLVVRLSVRISFPDDNLSKHQWIFTKLSMCIDIVEIWFRIAKGQNSFKFWSSYLPDTRPYFRFQTII